MDKVSLKKALIKDGYADNASLEATVERLMGLSDKPAEMLNAWFMNGTMPYFEGINGVDSVFLYQTLEMKAPAVILAFSMLLDDPIENSNYFKYLSKYKIGFYPPEM